MDTLLIKGCIKGKRKSQKELYKKYYGYALSIIKMYVHDDLEAREVLNDSFFKVFKNMKSFDQSKPFKPWLRKILVNSSINFYQKKKRQAKLVELSPMVQNKNEESAQSALNYQDMLKLLNKLPENYRMVFNLYVLEGYKHAEIAEMLDIKLGTSKSCLHRAKEMLKDLIKSQNQLYNVL